MIYPIGARLCPSEVIILDYSHYSANSFVGFVEMISIFNSAKRLVLHTGADLDAVLAAITGRIRPQPGLLDAVGWAHLRSGCFIGTMDGRNISVRYISGIRNSLQPTMHIHVESAVAGGTMVLARFSANLFVKAFLWVWLIGASTRAILCFAQGAMASKFSVIFPLGGLFIIMLMRAFARRDERELERMVRAAISEAESGSGNRK